MKKVILVTVILLFLCNYSFGEIKNNSDSEEDVLQFERLIGGVNTFHGYFFPFGSEGHYISLGETSLKQKISAEERYTFDGESNHILYYKGTFEFDESTIKKLTTNDFDGQIKVIVDGQILIDSNDIVSSTIALEKGKRIIEIVFIASDRAYSGLMLDFKNYIPNIEDINTKNFKSSISSESKTYFIDVYKNYESILTTIDLKNYSGKMNLIISSRNIENWKIINSENVDLEAIIFVSNNQLCFSMDIYDDVSLLQIKRNDLETLQEIGLTDYENSLVYYMRDYISNLDSFEVLENGYTLSVNKLNMNLDNLDYEPIIELGGTVKKHLYIELETVANALDASYKLDKLSGHIAIDYNDNKIKWDKSDRKWSINDGDGFFATGTVFEFDSRYYINIEAIYDIFENRIIWNINNGEVELYDEDHFSSELVQYKIPSKGKINVYIYGPNGLENNYYKIIQVDNFEELSSKYNWYLNLDLDGDFNYDIVAVQNYYSDKEKSVKLTKSKTTPRIWDFNVKFEKYYHYIDSIFSVKKGENVFYYYFGNFIPSNLYLREVSPLYEKEQLRAEINKLRNERTEVAYISATCKDISQEKSVIVSPIYDSVIICLASRDENKWVIKNPYNINIEAIVCSSTADEGFRSVIRGDIGNIPIFYTNEIPQTNDYLPVFYGEYHEDFSQDIIELDSYIKDVFSKRLYTRADISSEEEFVQTNNWIIDDLYYEEFDSIVKEIEVNR